MKRDLFIAVGILVILILLFFFCEELIEISKAELLIFYSQIAVLVMMFFALVFAMVQINETKRIEEAKTLIGIESLLEEMEYNQTLLGEYIEHSEVGVNIIPKDGRISWEWNKPRQAAYERYLILACKRNLVLAKEITTLYDKLESCKVIIETVQHFVVANLIEVKCITGGPAAFTSEIAKYNKQLYDISKEAKSLIPEIIGKLNRASAIKQAS